MRSEVLEAGYLGVEAGKVLFYDEGQFIDFDRPVVEYGFLSRYCNTTVSTPVRRVVVRRAYVVLVFPTSPWSL